MGVIQNRQIISGVIAMKRIIVLCLAVLLVLGAAATGYCQDSITCWFPPAWKNKPDQASIIAKALEGESGILVKPRIAKSYPEILSAFSEDEANLVYVGSFVQAIIKARSLGVPLVQNINGKEMYSGILVYPKGEDPAVILKDHPENIAFAAGASSGESSAKAATGGKASVGTPNHGVTCAAVIAGKVKAGVIKNWWWKANSSRFPTLEVYEIPGISLLKNPDNVLTASKAVSDEMKKKITTAAIANKDAFGAKEMKPFDSASLDFSLELMKKGQIDPLTYTW